VRVATVRAFGIKMGDDGGGAPIVRMGWHPDGLSVCLPLFFPCIIKSRRWRAVIEEVGKGCRELCVTAGTVTRTVKGTGRLWLFSCIFRSNISHWLKANEFPCSGPQV